jgi:hypothetical protein
MGYDHIGVRIHLLIHSFKYPLSISTFQQSPALIAVVFRLVTAKGCSPTEL